MENKDFQFDCLNLHTDLMKNCSYSLVEHLLILTKEIIDNPIGFEEISISVAGW